MVAFEVMEENLRATLAAFACAKAEGETRELDGVAVACPAVNLAMFNAATLIAPLDSVAALETRIGVAAEYFDARKVPWSFWLCEGWLDPRVRASVGGAFRRCGLHLVMDMPGMEALYLKPCVNAPPELEYRRVSDAATRADFNHIMTVSFNLPFRIAREIYESERIWRSDFTGWVAYRDGAPAATTATLTRGGVVGVYAVGTLPHHQRSGCADAVMRHALQQARAASGIERTMLQASEAGMSLYRNMGYRSIVRYVVYARS